jgi:hypothetical protein
MTAKYKFLSLLIAISLVQGFIYSVIIPPWQAPDEPRHFEYVKLLYEKRRLVGWGDVTPSVEQEIIASMDRYNFWQFGIVNTQVFPSEGLPQSFRDIWLPGVSHELHQPPLAYLVYATVLPFAGPDPATQLYAMRLISVIMGTLVVLASYLTMMELFPDDPFMFLAVPSFIAFLPMHAYTTSVLTNDNLAALLVSLVILLQVISLRRGLSVSRLTASVILLGLGIFTKRTALVALPIILVVIAIYLWRRGFRPHLAWKKAAVVLGSLSLLTVVAVLNWDRLRAFLVRLLPGLDRALDSLFYIYLFYFLRPSADHHYSLDPTKYFTADSLAYYRRFLQMLFETFWARFGWVNVQLHPLCYLLIGLVCLTSAFGLVVFIFRNRRAAHPMNLFQKDALLVFGTAILFGFGMLVVKMIRDWDNVPRPLTQGKFLFPVIIPIAALFMVGLRELAPPSRRGHLLLGWLGGLVLLEAISLLAYIIPFYYG